MSGLVIRGGDLCSASVSGRFDLRCEYGKIVAVGREIGPEPGDRVVDASGLLVLPGLIDVHVHFRDPGSPERESFLTGTAAAASNGVTTVLEMPTSDVPVTTAARLERRGAHLSGRSFVDFGLYAGAGYDSLDEVGACARAGAIAFKTFTHRPKPARADAFEGLWAVTEPHLLQTMSAVAATGRVHAVHCENDRLLDHFATAPAAGAGFGERHRRSRPPVAENAAIATVGSIALTTGSRVHLVHVSTARGVDIAEGLRRAGADISVETCPHYLLLEEDTLDRYGSYATCNPPLRGRDARMDLLERLRDGRVDIIASDHCSYTAEELDRHAEDPCGALPGLPGIEFLMPSLLALARRPDQALADVVARMTSVPARRFGLTGKGDLVIGNDADLVVVDPRAAVPFSPDARFLARGSRNAVYLGDVELRGRAVATFVRGTAVFSDGAVAGSPGHGRWIRGTGAGRPPR
ncbi:allantoinase [Streptosporangium violaceochromogenes]|nr:allantoinase [Streptosporangium violaceochromogenes]